MRGLHVRGDGDFSLSVRKRRLNRISVFAIVVAAVLLIAGMSVSAFANPAAHSSTDETSSDISAQSNSQSENGDIRPLATSDTLTSEATLDIPFSATMYGWPPETSGSLSFTYTITAAEGNQNDGCSIQNGETKTVSFESGKNLSTSKDSFQLKFTKSGTYTFTVSQTAPEGISDSVLVDKRTYTFTVEVSNENASELSYKLTKVGSTTVNSKFQSAPIEFQNFYVANKDDKFESAVTVKKNLEGREWLSSDQFSFKAEFKSSNSKPEISGFSGKDSATINSQDGSLAWYAWNVRASDNVEAVYELSEQVPNGATEGVYRNITYDQSKYTIVYHLTNYNASSVGCFVYSTVYKCDYETYQSLKNAKGASNGEDSSNDGGASKGEDALNEYYVPGNEVVFNNTYKADGTATINIHKTISGRNFKSGDSFTFTLEKASNSPENTPMPTTKGEEGNMGSTDSSGVYSNTLNYGDQTSTNTYTQVFAKIPFDQTHVGKTYHYVVKENDPSIEDLIASTTEHTLSITPYVDAQTGEMKFNIASDGDTDPSFVNTYKMNVTPAQIDGDGGSDPNKNYVTVSKTLSGRDWNASDSFSFSIKSTSVPDWPQGYESLQSGNQSQVVLANDTITVSGGDATGTDGALSADFGDIQFWAPGTYKFTVQEDRPSEAPASGPYQGILYDTSHYDLTVQVKETANGDDKTLSIENIALSKAGTSGTTTGPMIFNNQYATNNPGTIEPSVFEITKSIAGRPWMGGESYTFNLARSSSNPTGGISGDLATQIQITAPSAHYQQAVTKSFCYSNTPLTVSKPGTYVYTITETNNNQPWMTYDTTPRTLTIEATDDGFGNITVTNTQIVNNTPSATEGVGPNFVNVYEASGNAMVSITERLQGRNFQDGDQFTYTLTPTGDNAESAPMPEGATGGSATYVMDCSTSLNSNTNTVADAFTIPLNTSSGTYTYTITEEATGLPGGVESTSKSVTMTLTCTDDGAGNILPVITYEPTASGTDGNPTALFENSYVASGELEAGSILIEKTFQVTGDDAFTANSMAFEFEVEDTTAYQPGVQHAMLSTDPITATVTSGSSSGLTDTTKATASVGAIGFKQPGSYSFHVLEIHNTDYPVIDYSNVHFTVKVEVRDKAGSPGELEAQIVEVIPEGSSEAAPTPSGNKVTLPFLNGYDAQSASTELAVTKVLEGRPLDNSDTFQFDVTVDDGKGAPESSTLEISGPSQSDPYSHTRDYSLSFENSGTYTVTLAEQIPSGDERGMTYDTQTHTVVYTVEDTDNNGYLDITSTTLDGKQITDPEVNVTFVNTYSATAETQLKLTKRMDGRNFLEDDAFSFTLVGESDASESNAPMPAESSSNTYTNELTYADVTTTNVSTQVFATIPLTQDNIGHTYTYTLQEVAGEITDVSYDQSTVKATAEVLYDPETAGISVIWNFSSDNAGAGSNETFEWPLFVNTYAPYTPTPPTSDNGSDNGSDGSQGSDSEGSVLAPTGDAVDALPFIVAGIAALCIAVIAIRLKNA